MAILAYDDTMLREPRLLVPGMQPLRPVKIDRSNGFGSVAHFCYLPHSSVDLACGLTATETGLTKSIVKEKKAVSTTAGNILIPKRIPAGGRSFLFHTNSFFGDGTRVLLTSDTSIAAYWLGTTSTKKLSVGGTVSSANNVWTDNVDSLTMFVTNGASHQIYLNGALVADGSSTLAEGTGIGTRVLSGSSSNSYQCFASLYLFACFARAFTAGEVEALSRDPYQFLIPA